MTTTFRREIKFDRDTKDFRATLDGNFIGYFGSYHAAEVALDQVAYDLLMDAQCATAAELDGGSDAGSMAEEVAAAVVAPNPGIHLNQYTVVLSQPDQAFWYEVKTLCDACRATTSNASKMGEVVNGYCDACGVGPSVSHFRLETAPESSVRPDVLTTKEALTLLDAINTAHQNGLDTTGTRAWLAGYGYKTKLSVRTSAWVPDGNGHGWQYVTGERLSDPPSSLCPYCDDTGLIPNGSGTGDQAGGWADTCACQDRRDPPVDDPSPLPPPWERLDPPAEPEPHPSPLPPIGPYPLSDAAELAAEISAVDGLPLSEARTLAADHLRRVTHGAGTVCTNCGDYGHLAINCPSAPLPLPRPRPRRPSPFPIAAAALLAEADRVMAEVSYAAERLEMLVAA